MIRIFIAFTLLCFSATTFSSPTVVPSDRVVTGVKVRSSASTTSQEIGKLMPGDSAEFTGEVPRWYQINHPDLGQGFVSKAWTNLILEGDESVSNEYEVYVVDVGTGLAVFVKGPDFTLVYDAGSNDDLSGNRFLDFLDVVAPNIGKIDHVIISHPHRDHISMLTGLLQRVEVGEIWDSGVVYSSCTYQKLMEAIEAENTVYHTAIHNNSTGDVNFLKDCSATGSSVTLNFGSRMNTGSVSLGKTASMNFLYVDAAKKSDVNENSLVLMLNLADTKILLTGDSGGGGRADPSTPPEEGSVEHALIECCSDAIVADVIILGHHGSKTSSRGLFLDAVSASDYIISSGPKEYSGTSLPDPEVVQQVLSRPGAKLYKTYEDDDACKTNPEKIGTDNDGKAGGCNTIKIYIKPDSTREITTLSN